MDGFKRLLTFGLGGAIGTAVGVVVASLMAPQSGRELQKSTEQFVDEVKRAGDQAQTETEDKLRARFKNKVGDPHAFEPVSTPS